MENNGAKQPLLLNRTAENDGINHSSFVAHEEDIAPIKSPKDFFRESWVELKKTLYLAAPATFMGICQYSLGAITQTFAGQLNTLDLAAVSVENSVIAGFSFGALLGMGSALETLCGQAFGAGQLEMLGIYMQRSWVILNTTALLFSLLYIFATPLLRFIGETSAISEAAVCYIKNSWMRHYRQASPMDAPATICICDDIPYNEVPTSTTQGDGHGSDIRGGVGPTHLLFMVADA